MSSQNIISIGNCEVFQNIVPSLNWIILEMKRVKHKVGRAVINTVAARTNV